MSDGRVRMTRMMIPLAGLGLIGAMAFPARAQWTVTNLNPAGTIGSTGYGTGGGQQVGFAQVGPTVGDFRASLWSGTAGSWVNLHPTAMGYSIAHAAGGGQQVGEYDPVGFPRAALWSGTAASWIDLHPAGATNSIAYGVAGGQQVGVTTTGVSHAALWTGSAASWVDLNPPPTGRWQHNSEAFATDGVHQVGDVVDVGGVISASLWSGSAATWVNLHPVGNISSWAYGVDGAQQVGVVRVPDTSSHAALWSGTAGSWVDLHPAGANNSQAYGVHGGKQVGRVVTSGVVHANIWSGTAASRVDLHAFLPAQFVSSEAHGIWSDGTGTYVVGYGYNNSTQRTEALLWTLAAPPCVSDVTGNGAVDIDDLLAVISSWGPCAGCAADIAPAPGGNGIVDIDDLLAVINGWGACP